MMLQQQKGQVAPHSPSEQGLPIQQGVEKHRVEVVFGSNYEHFEVPKGETLGKVLADVRIKEAIGYGNAKDNLEKVVVMEDETFHQVGDDYVITGKEKSIELIRPAGAKA